MLKKVIGKAKDAIYETVVEKDAEELAKYLGNQAAIEAYVEKNKIPERKSAYEMLYDVLLEKLDDEQAQVLYNKKFYFVERKKLSVLWEAFADVTAEARLLEALERTETRLAKVQRLQCSLSTKEQNLQTERANILAQLGKPVKAAEVKEEIIKEEIIKEEIIKENVQEITQDTVLNELCKEEQLFGENLHFDPNLREEPPTEEIEDSIMRNF